MQNRTKLHFGVAKRILRYVAGIVDYGIYYTKALKFDLCGFTDSDWASSIDNRKSTSTSIFNIGSGAISWSSKKQATIALSSSEVEYIAACGFVFGFFSPNLQHSGGSPVSLSAPSLPLLDVDCQHSAGGCAGR
ncbi:hypothetical protein ZIOFF_019077 [Zingiber officinale]|uniref:Mitochondrial protein n=1 Tax=Zingiber officinale TaxID=94328 RepID=A0A8J5HLJ6_ZINOF|nr:hypothetical protein ZIOFF_019077 [Zingiber officinale]